MTVSAITPLPMPSSSIGSCTTRSRATRCASVRPSIAKIVDDSQVLEHSPHTAIYQPAMDRTLGQLAPESWTGMAGICNGDHCVPCRTCLWYARLQLECNQ